MDTPTPLTNLTNLTNRFYWRLIARLPFESSQELLGRLLVERPLWDPQIAKDPEAPPESKVDHILSMVVRVGGEEDFGGLDLDYFRETLKRVTQNRPLVPKLEIIWLPCPPPEERQEIHQLGPWLINVEPNPARRVLSLPEPLWLSPRAKAIATLALEALTERLTPPPGAPETRGLKTLILEEGPALLTAAALLSGSGPITLVTIEEATTQSALAIAEQLGRTELLEIIHSPLTALAKEFDHRWRDAFNLAIISRSPYAIGRRLKNFLGWITPDQGRLIVAGPADGLQSTFILKNSFKAGFFLHSSAAKDGFCVINLARRPPLGVPVWDWSPGAWLAELTLDEQSVLDEAEALDKKSPAKTGQKPGRAEAEENGGSEELDNAGQDDTIDETLDEILVNGEPDEAGDNESPEEGLENDGLGEATENADLGEVLEPEKPVEILENVAQDEALATEIPDEAVEKMVFSETIENDRPNEMAKKAELDDIDIDIEMDIDRDVDPDVDIDADIDARP
ncbi:MAG: hypothetical protein LBT86_00070 [Deltaproteobacteria bacterium]|jgi:hypothetical protein|nr:hypothetical protein [Deltaproteobacteria bacterium]